MYLSDHKISRPLAVRVQRNAQYSLDEQTRKAPEGSIELLKLISDPLRVELHYEIYSSTLFKHPFFLCYNHLNSSGLQKACHTAVSLLSLSRGDTLFSQLEVPVCPRMFYVMEGSLQYSQEGRQVTVSGGSWMCEAALWTTWRHYGTLKAKSETQLLTLDATKLQTVFCTFPTPHASVYGEQFVIWLNMKRVLGGLSDEVDFDDDFNERIAFAFPEWVELADVHGVTAMASQESLWSSASHGVNSLAGMLSLRSDGTRSLRYKHNTWSDLKDCRHWMKFFSFKAGRCSKRKSLNAVVPHSLQGQ